MRVVDDTAEAGEVLEPGGHADRLQAAHERGNVLADPRRLVAERPDPDRGVPRVRGQVADRGVVDRHAHRTKFQAGRPGDPLGQRRIAGCAERHVASERRDAVAEGIQLPAFLVRRDQQRRDPLP